MRIYLPSFFVCTDQKTSSSRKGFYSLCKCTVTIFISHYLWQDHNQNEQRENKSCISMKVYYMYERCEQYYFLVGLFQFCFYGQSVQAQILIAQQYCCKAHYPFDNFYICAWKLYFWGMCSELREFNTFNICVALWKLWCMKWSAC